MISQRRPTRRTFSPRFATPLVLAAASSLAPAQEQPMFEVRTEGLAAVEPAGKDKAVYDALQQLGARLDDLTEELGLEAVQQRAISLGWDLMRSGLSLSIDVGEQGPSIGLATRSTGPNGAAGFAESLGWLADQAGLPMEVGEDGSTLIGTPAGTAILNTVDHADGMFTRLSVGSPSEITPGVARYGLADGVRPLMSMRADMAKIGTVVLPPMRQSNPAAAAEMEKTGVFGEDGPVIEFAMGTGGRLLHGVTRIERASSIFGVLDKRNAIFTRDVLSQIPADAVRLQGNMSTAAPAIQQIEMVGEQQGVDLFEQVSDMLGVDVKKDVLENLGPRVLFYQSESTGGGGMLSTIVIVEVADPGAFARAQDSIIKTANDAARENANGYVRLRSWTCGDSPAVSLTFPGLPVPLEISWAMVGDRLVLAAAPGGLRVAIDQITSPKSSVADNPAFQKAVGSRWPEAGAAAFAFTDTARSARKGYGLASMATTMIANAVRSPAQPDRVSGTLMPAYGVLVDDIAPYGMLSRWDGDTMIMEMQMDRSVLVQMASLGGTISDVQGVAGPALAAGVLLPAIGKARESAKQLKSSTQVRGVVQAMILYSTNEDKGPASLDELIEEGFIPREILDSPYGPAFDGGPDITLRLDLSADEALSFAANQIVAIDRSMLMMTGTACVGFADGHVQVLSLWELEDYLAMDVNEGAREALQIPD